MFHINPLLINDDYATYSHYCKYVTRIGIRPIDYSDLIMIYLEH